MPNPASRETIAVDVDDVVFPFVPPFVKYLGEQGIVVTPEHFTTYDLSQIYPIEKSKAAKLVAKFVEAQHVLIDPVPGSVEAIGKLSHRYEVDIMTARDKRFERLTRQWFAQHFPDSIRNIHVIDAHYAAGGSPAAKAEACLRLGVDYLIDDLPIYINEVAKVGVKTLLFGDYAWNRTAELHPSVTRVKNWQEVLEYFDGKAQ
jgi:uncharacterized HAD superfamily protein